MYVLIFPSVIELFVYELLQWRAGDGAAKPPIDKASIPRKFIFIDASASGWGSKKMEELDPKSQLYRVLGGISLSAGSMRIAKGVCCL